VQIVQPERGREKVDIIDNLLLNMYYCQIMKFNIMNIVLCLTISSLGSPKRMRPNLTEAVNSDSSRVILWTSDSGCVVYANGVCKNYLTQDDLRKIEQNQEKHLIFGYMSSYFEEKPDGREFIVGISSHAVLCERFLSFFPENLNLSHLIERNVHLRLNFLHKKNPPVLISSKRPVQMEGITFGHCDGDDDMRIMEISPEALQQLNIALSQIQSCL
jgi:hypothetical protein